MILICFSGKITNVITSKQMLFSQGSRENILLTICKRVVNKWQVKFRSKL